MANTGLAKGDRRWSLERSHLEPKGIDLPPGSNFRSLESLTETPSPFPLDLPWRQIPPHARHHASLPLHVLDP